jgi:glycosyltransferase involved in cell wall biosynthesis
MSNYHLSLVIPVYNEEENLENLNQKIKEVLTNSGYQYEIIFVNDGSIDKSFEILKKIAAFGPDIKIINFRKNFGQTAALAAGINHAQGEIIVPLDADLESNPADIPKLLAKIKEGYDIVSGWRKNRWQNKFFSRRLTSMTANWLISAVTKVKLHDYGCTLKAYRCEIIKEVGLYGEMHRFIPALASWQGARVTEIEVNYQPRRFGKSNYGLGRTFKVILDLMTIKFLSGYSTKPIHFFGAAGFISIFIGFLAGGLAVYYKLTQQKDFISTPLPVLTALFFIVGVLFILIGFLAEMIMRVYHETQRRPIYSIKEKINFPAQGGSASGG